MKTINTKRFEVGIHTDRKHGWFEHHEHGDEYGGGLWFEADGTLYGLRRGLYDSLRSPIRAQG
jgi:hypothetical protein